MRDAGVIDDGALAIQDGIIVAVGRTTDVRAAVAGAREIDARGKVVCPGFIDPHTHLVYAGDRVDEWEMKLAGAAYLDILAAGGGIVSTMRATREATFDALLDQSRARLDVMFRHGVTTCEIKTGYGLSLDAELKMLRVVEALAQSHPCDVLPTVLAAHSLPPEYRGAPDDYVTLVADRILPAAAEWFEAGVSARHASPLGCDVYCERSAFDPSQARRVLEAGKRHGMRLTIHADQFNSLGGVPMALELGAASCDHLDVTTADDRARLARSLAVAVVLPAATFHLGAARYADARALIDDGCALALSTDHNPGSAPCLSPALVMAIACRFQQLSPAEALNACTINAAHALGQGRRVGSLEPGKQADALIVDAPDFRHLAYQFGVNRVRDVVKNGRLIA